MGDHPHKTEKGIGPVQSYKTSLFSPSYFGELLYILQNPAQLLLFLILSYCQSFLCPRLTIQSVVVCAHV